MTKPRSVNWDRETWAEYKAKWSQEQRRAYHESQSWIVPNTEDRVAAALDDVLAEAERLIGGPDNVG